MATSTREAMVPQKSEISFGEYVAYRYFGGFGGRRKALPTDKTKNGQWRNKSFQAYADYMQTEQFEEALNQLLEVVRGKTVAIMCAEAVLWRCHRSLIGALCLFVGTLFTIL